MVGTDNDHAPFYNVGTDITDSMTWETRQGWVCMVQALQLGLILHACVASAIHNIELNSRPIRIRMNEVTLGGHTWGSYRKCHCRCGGCRQGQCWSHPAADRSAGQEGYTQYKGVPGLRLTHCQACMPADRAVQGTARPP